MTVIKGSDSANTRWYYETVTRNTSTERKRKNKSASALLGVYYESNTAEHNHALKGFNVKTLLCLFSSHRDILLQYNGITLLKYLIADSIAESMLIIE